MGVINFISSQDEKTQKYLFKNIQYSIRKFKRWSTSKSPARREFCDVAGYIFIHKHPKLKYRLAKQSHQDLLHFIVIWRYQNQVQDSKSWSMMFGVGQQSAASWMLKAERSPEEAYKLVIACIGYNTFEARLAIKGHAQRQTKK
jgi:hypothetical protein